MNRPIFSIVLSLSLTLPLLACGANDGPDDSFGTSEDNLYKICDTLESESSCKAAGVCSWAGGSCGTTCIWLSWDECIRGGSRCAYDYLADRCSEAGSGSGGAGTGSGTSNGGEPGSGKRSWSCTYDVTVRDYRTVEANTVEEAYAVIMYECGSRYSSCIASTDWCSRNSMGNWYCPYYGTTAGVTTSPSAFTAAEAKALTEITCRAERNVSGCSNISCR